MRFLSNISDAIFGTAEDNARKEEARLAQRAASAARFLATPRIVDVSLDVARGATAAKTSSELGPASASQTKDHSGGFPDAHFATTYDVS